MSMLRTVIMLGMLEVFAPISMDLYMPTLPDLARDLGTGDSLAQATMSACMLGLALGQLVAGPLSDRLGRRRPLLVGIACFTGIMLFTVAVTLLHETLVPASRQTGRAVVRPQRFLAVLKDPLFVFVVLTATCCGAGFFTYLASISFVLQNGFSLSAQVFSVFFAGNAVMSVIGSQLNRAVVRRAGTERMYTLATTLAGLMALSILGTVLLHLGLIPLTITLALLMFCNGSIIANGSALALSGHGRHAGTAAALLGTSNFAVGPVVAPLVALNGTSAMSMAITMTVAYGTAACLVWLAVRPKLARRHIWGQHRNGMPG